MIRWASLPWPQVEDAVIRSRVALLPLGAIEEHGPHLTVGADWAAAEALGARIADAADLILLPPLPYGQVWSLAEYPGSLSISDDTLVSLISDLGSGLRLAGIAGLVLLSAHLGNVPAMKTASRRLQARQIESLQLFYPGLAEVSAAIRTTPPVAASLPGGQAGTAPIVHADEIETSILLELAPDQVDMTMAVADGASMPADVLHSAERWREYSASGVFGDATKATGDLGRQLVAFVERRAVELIQAWRDRKDLLP